MSKKDSYSKSNKSAQSPTSADYVKKAKNKALQNTPYGKDEPSTRTDYK